MRVPIIFGPALLLAASTVSGAQQASAVAPELPPIPARVSIHVGSMRQAAPFTYRTGSPEVVRYGASGTVLSVRLGTSLADGVGFELTGSIARDARIDSDRVWDGDDYRDAARVTISELVAVVRVAPARACIRRVCGNVAVGGGRKVYDFARSEMAYSDYIARFEPDQVVATFLGSVGVRFPVRGSTVMIDLVDTTNPLRYDNGRSSRPPHDVSLQFGIEKALRRRAQQSR